MGGSAKKVGLRIKELERIYGIYQGGSGYYGNQHEESSNNYKTPKTEEDIAKEIGISISTLQNYKKLTEMIPELEELVDTGITTPTTALAVMRTSNKLPSELLQSNLNQTSKQNYIVKYEETRSNSNRPERKYYIKETGGIVVSLLKFYIYSR